MKRQRSTHAEIESLLRESATDHRAPATGRVAQRVQAQLATAGAEQRITSPLDRAGFDLRLWLGGAAALAAVVALSLGVIPRLGGPQAEIAPSGPTALVEPAPAVARGGARVVLARFMATAPEPLRQEAQALRTTAEDLTRELIDRALGPTRALAPVVKIGGRPAV